MTALLLGGTAAAQSPGTLLVGGFVSWTKFDSNWGLDTGFGNSIGYGGRVGAFIAPNWNIEADGQYIPAQAATGTDYAGLGVPGGDVKGSNLSARLVYSFPLGNLPSIHIGAGGVLQNFRGAENAGGATYQFGANGLAGFNLGFGGVSLRVDGLLNYFPSNGGKFDFGAQAGLQISPDLRNLFGGGALRIQSCMHRTSGGMNWMLRFPEPLNSAGSFSGHGSMTTLAVRDVQLQKTASVTAVAWAFFSLTHVGNSKATATTRRKAMSSRVRSALQPTSMRMLLRCA